MSIKKNVRIELRHLRIFLTVAHEKNFTRAANVLHMAQPPLSRQMRELEVAVGADLFDRTTRSVAITAAGNAFLQQIQVVFPQIDFAIQAARNAAKGHEGSLSLGYTGRASQVLLPGLLREFKSRYPSVTVDIDGPYPTGRLKQDLLAQRIDLALCFLPVEEAGLGTTRLLRTTLSIALPVNHRLAQAEVVTVRELRDESFVAYPSSQGFSLRVAMEAECQHAGFRPRVVRESTSSQTLLCLVAAGTGIALIPAETASFLTDGVVFKPLSSSVGKLDHGVVWLESNQNPTLHNMLEIALSMPSRQ